MTTLLVSAIIIFAIFLTLVFIVSMIKLVANKRVLQTDGSRRTSRRRTQEGFRKVDPGSPGMIALYIFLGIFLIGIFGGIWHLSSKDKTNPYWNR